MFFLFSLRFTLRNSQVYLIPRGEEFVDPTLILGHLYRWGEVAVPGGLHTHFMVAGVSLVASWCSKYIDDWLVIVALDDTRRADAIQFLWLWPNMLHWCRTTLDLPTVSKFVSVWSKPRWYSTSLIFFAMMNILFKSFNVGLGYGETTPIYVISTSQAPWGWVLPRQQYQHSPTGHWWSTSGLAWLGHCLQELLRVLWAMAYLQTGGRRLEKNLQDDWGETWWSIALTFLTQEVQGRAKPTFVCRLICLTLKFENDMWHIVSSTVPFFGICNDWCVR